MNKYRLAEMSWVEAEEAFKRSDTVIIGVGTLHGHGPTPIGIDASSVEKLADEVGQRTGLMVLPPLYYGENDKMREYPGSLAISQDVLERFYTDIWRSLHRNGVRKIIVLNGHGGNREPLIRSGRNVRELGMLVAILEWWNIDKRLTADAFPEGTHIMELAVAAAVGGTELIDLRDNGYKGEWGINPPLRHLFGEQIRPLGFNNFEHRGAPVIIPVDAWDIDLESPPQIERHELEALRRRGEASIERLADYIAGFARAFQQVDVTAVLAKS